MKRFEYKAKDSKTGKVVKGMIQADTERTAGKLLVEQGYAPISVVEEGQKSLFAGFGNKITTKEKIVFTRQFATLIGAGLPLATSLRSIASQTENKVMKSVIEDVLANVEGGKNLTDACAKHPEVFDKVYISLIQAGEMSGTLDLSLKRLAAQQEKDAAVMSKIKGALTSPGITLVVIVAVVIFLMLEVVPQVENLYESLGKDLPALTAVMVVAANFLMAQWWILIIVIGVLAWGFMQFRKTDIGIRWAALFKLNVPLFKELFRRLYMARFARTMENLLSTGVAMLDSMEISAEAMNNVVLQKEIQEAETKVRAGRPLSKALEERDYILPLVPQMASIGEESGKIDEMLGKAAQVYEDEVDEQVRSISAMIEPIMMVLLAVLAGGIIGAILFPIYGLVNSVG